MTRPDSLRPGERLDDLMCHGRHIIQDTREFCFSLDAVLLAHFPRLHGRDRVLELGTGTGVIPLLVADRVTHVDAIELSGCMAELAERNVQLNDMAGRIKVLQGDYRQIESLTAPERYDMVLANPPYRPVGRGTPSRLTAVARARHEYTATLADVVRAARYALRFGGHFAMVHIPERLGEIMVELDRHQLAPKRLQLIAPKPGKAPNLLLIEAVVGGAAGGLQVLPQLVIHEEDGSYTPELKHIYGMD